jgi:hypothetical protein
MLPSPTANPMQQRVRVLRRSGGLLGSHWRSHLPLLRHPQCLVWRHRRLLRQPLLRRRNCQQPPSDRALKANFATVDPTDILQRVRELPITTWNYTSDDPAVRHVGPMAQDFAALFAVGADDRHIHPLDGQGVALAAIQGLLAQIDALQADNARLAARVAALERSEEPVTMPYNEAPASTT